MRCFLGDVFRIIFTSTHSLGTNNEQKMSFAHWLRVFRGRFFILPLAKAVFAGCGVALMPWQAVLAKNAGCEVKNCTWEGFGRKRACRALEGVFLHDFYGGVEWFLHGSIAF